MGVSPSEFVSVRFAFVGSRIRIILHVLALVLVIRLTIVVVMNMGGADVAERLTLVACAILIAAGNVVARFALAWVTATTSRRMIAHEPLPTRSAESAGPPRRDWILGVFDESQFHWCSVASPALVLGTVLLYRHDPN